MCFEGYDDALIKTNKSNSFIFGYALPITIVASTSFLSSAKTKNSLISFFALL